MPYYNSGTMSPADYWAEQQGNQRNTMQNVLNLMMTMKQMKMQQAEQQKTDTKEQEKWQFEQKKYTNQMAEYQKEAERQRRLDEIDSKKSNLDMRYKDLQIQQLQNAPTLEQKATQKINIFKQEESVKHKNAIELLKIRMEADRVKQEKEDLDGVSKARIDARKAKATAQKSLVQSAMKRLGDERNRINTEINKDTYIGDVDDAQSQIQNIDRAIDYIGNMQFNMVNGGILGEDLQGAVKAFTISGLDKIKSGKTLQDILTYQGNKLDKEMGITKLQKAKPPSNLSGAPTATNPKTGEKIAYINGKWVKI